MAADAWTVARRVGSAEEHHAAVLDPITQRTITVCELSRSGLVLGSTQTDDLVDRDECAHLGLDIVRRRTGGGAVIVRPEQVVWLDLSMPRDDPLWVDDVGGSSAWLGEAWAVALRSLGFVATAHGGEPVCSRWGRLCCFAGIDRHEVRMGDRKAVGIAQRRRRDGASFQALAYIGAHDPAEVVDVLAAPAADDGPALAAHLRGGVAVLPNPAAEVVEALVAVLT